MPYKDPERKKQWESQHRARRIARRHQLRRIEIAKKADQAPPPDTQSGFSGGLWAPIAGSVALAIYNPKLATGIGALVLVSAAALKKDWRWWLVGVTALLLGLLLYWSDTTKARTFKRTPLEIKNRFPLFTQLQQQSSHLTMPITSRKILRPASLRSDD